MSDREQSFVARYEFRPPMTATKVERFYVVVGGVRHYVGRDEDGRALAAFLATHGVPLTSKIETPEHLADVEKEFGERAIGAYRELQTLVGPDSSEGSVDLSLYNGRFEVRTPSRLGNAVHKQRRRVIEDWLRGERIEWTLTCATEHSDAVCRPLDAGERRRAEASA